MQKPIEVLNIFEKYTPLVDKEIQDLLAGQGDLFMYDMMSYFFGYLDEGMQQSSIYGGKRFRSGICMLLSDFYGNLHSPLEVASSIEIFHNFTLIHDDIADGDTMRRGRPTVWSKWGINHGINTGDAQLLLSSKEINRFILREPVLGVKILDYVTSKYLEVAEGQFLDFTYSELALDNPEISEENTRRMIEKKSGVLVGVSTKCAGLINGLPADECEALYDYGFNLGLAYQLADDLMSIWGTADESGKDELMDLYDKKKTLPIIYLYNNVNAKDKVKLTSLYAKKGNLTKEEVLYVKNLLDTSGAEKYVLSKARERVAIVDASVNKLTIKDEDKEVLHHITRALLPNVCGDEPC